MPRPQNSPHILSLPVDEQRNAYPGFFNTCYYVRKSKGRLPEIGDTVQLRINGLGPALVTGHFIEHGWLGFYAKPLDPPQWAQNHYKNREEPTQEEAEWRSKFPGVYQHGEGMFFPIDITPQED
tara:strand:+ start:144 stop:515 length:372 start_codon:yes stop_codon:yes gene_type:complete